MQKRMKEVQKVRKKKGKWIKELVAIVLSICMLTGMMPMGLEVLKPLEVEAAGINDSNVFIKQQTTVTCTLASATMMLRRTAILSGRSDWASITESSVENVAWLDGVGLRYNFSYNGMTVSRGSFSGDKKSQLINLLSKYPQGIVAYNGNAGQLHAVLITDYTSGVFYCADPATQVAGGRIPLSQSSISGVGQDGKIANFTSYWYVSSPTVSLPQSTGTVKGVDADGVTNIGKHTATINAHAVIEGGAIGANQMEVCFAIGEKSGALGGKRGHYRELSGGANGRIDFIYNTNDARYPDLVLREGTRYWYQVYAKRLSDGVEFASKEESFVTAIDFTPQNLGSSFYAYIKSKDSNMYISNPSVSSDSKTAAQLKQKASGGTNNELWCFTRQSNGAYKIQSVFDSRFMCPWNGSVYAGYADTAYWYIQKDMGGYRLRQFEYAASGLGVSSKTEGSAISFCDVKPSVASQIFDIQIVAPENVTFRPSAVDYTGGHVYEMYDSCVNWTQANAIAKKKVVIWLQ